jgi:GAF domain-containing protein
VRKGLAIYGASEEALTLVPALEQNAEVELVGIYASDVEAARRLARRLRITAPIGGDGGLFLRPLHAVIDAGVEERPFAAAFPAAATADLQVVSPLTARLLWGIGAGGPDRKAELLQALHEIVESVNLTIDTDELFSRMLEIAMGVTGADGGSLMLLDEERGELFIRVAAGVEPELWPKIRVKLGEGVAGRAAAEARPIRVRGRADADDFRLSRQRMDVESALCVPLVHASRVLGVLNLHHRTRTDLFADADLEFAEQLGRRGAAIVARAEEHETLARQASRYAAVTAVRESLAGDGPLEARLEALCTRVAALLGGGIATVYLYSDTERELRLAATSLAGGGLGGEYRIQLGQGLDGRAAEQREPLFLESRPGAIDLASLPLVSGPTLVGVLSVQAGPGTPGSSARALRERLLEISAAAADTIAQARREARMSARATKIGAINETGIRLVSSRDLAEVTRLATSSAVFILEADHAVLRLQDPETRRFAIRSYYGSADGRTQEQLFRLDKQVALDTLRAQRARVLPDLSRDAGAAPLAGGFRSALAAPLRRDGRIVGTLALYDKVTPDRFFAGAFGEDDLQVFGRLVSYVERGIENALFHATAQRHQSFDEETGLPNAEYLLRRTQQELARAGGREGALALVTCRLDNLPELRRADARRSELLVQRAAEALRTHLREFDVLARTGEDEFAALLPDPGAAPEERVTALARAVAEEIAKDEALAGGARASLAFGYAVHPAEGADRDALLARARKPRIRMV